jgi:hypothetical protein
VDTGTLQIVLVNDGSSDNSDEVCLELHARYPSIVTYVELAKNFGEHNAVMPGLPFTMPVARVAPAIRCASWSASGGTWSLIFRYAAAHQHVMGFLFSFLGFVLGVAWSLKNSVSRTRKQ